jgi:hypothetical protein
MPPDPRKEIVWDVIQDDLIPLIRNVNHLLANDGE